MSSTIGNLFTDVGVKICVGRLDYVGKSGQVMVALDLASVLPLCRRTPDGEIECYCRPWPSIEEPPYLQADLQLCRTKGKREKIGWVCSIADAYGAVTYRVMLNCAALLKRYGIVWVHLHSDNRKEE